MRAGAGAAPPGHTLRQVLLQPATLTLVAINLVPLIGILVWGWDAFVLLMLYWMETAIIAFWSMVRLATLPGEAVGDLTFGAEKRTISRPALIAVFTANAAGFMAVHLLLLWVMFAGDWSRRIHSVRDFIRADGGRDRALAAAAAAVHRARPRAVVRSHRAWALADVGASASRHPARPPAREPQGEAILLGLYVRIFIMQLTIIVGVWFALVIGSVAPFIILIIIKTVFDVVVSCDRRPRAGGDAARQGRWRGEWLTRPDVSPGLAPRNQSDCGVRP